MTQSIRLNDFFFNLFYFILGQGSYENEDYLILRKNKLRELIVRLDINIYYFRKSYLFYVLNFYVIFDGNLTTVKSKFGSIQDFK